LKFAHDPNRLRVALETTQILHFLGVFGRWEPKSFLEAIVPVETLLKPVSNP
jgi:hypothetical protein